MVVDGIMYVTTANQVFALYAVSGRQIWHYSRPRTPELVRDAAGGPLIGPDGKVVYLMRNLEFVEVTKRGPDHRAAMRLLEAIRASRFSPKHQLKVEGGVDHRHAVEMSPEDEAIATRIASARLGVVEENGPATTADLARRFDRLLPP